jgi:hypothetical protein
MNNFIRIDIDSKLDSKSILEIFLRELPDFTWRLGNSDAQGSYVSGTNSEKIKIQCWTDGNPMAFSMSFKEWL